MTSRRNLGPILAIAGLVVVAGAVIAGFIITGGPGDARDRRLDDLVMQKVAGIANAAQCSYVTKGAAPATIDEIKAAAEVLPPPDAQERCYFGQMGRLDDLAGIDYSVKDKNRVEICATFRRPSPDQRGEGWQLYGGRSQFAELHQDRPQAGRHCFELKLLELTPAPPN